jgi:hypothetical protein
VLSLAHLMTPLVSGTRLRARAASQAEGLLVKLC